MRPNRCNRRFAVAAVLTAVLLIPAGQASAAEVEPYCIALGNTYVICI